MSYHTYHDYGYGTCLNDLTFDSVESIKKLLSFSPELEKDIDAWLEECEITEPTVEDYLNYDQDYQHGMATLLVKVIEEAEGIEFLSSIDFDGRIYLMYPQLYPWQMNEKDKLVTEEIIEKIVSKYLKIVTDSPFQIGYVEAENGG